MKKPMTELGSILCNYCSGIPFLCEGSNCSVAYQVYLDEEDDDEED